MAWAPITSATYVQSFAVTNPDAVFFSSDGTRMFVLTNPDDIVTKYSLSTAWDISTASSSQTVDLTAYDSDPDGLFFKADGTKMYVTADGSNNILEFSLTAWDLSTLSLDNTFSISAQETGPAGIFISSDGTDIYITGSNAFGGGTNRIHQYSMSAWDLSSASYVRTLDPTGDVNTPVGIFLSPTGGNMYISGHGGDFVYKVYDFSLSTPGNISTATLSQTFTPAGALSLGGSLGLFLTEDRMYLADAEEDGVYQFSFPSSGIAAVNSVTWANLSKVSTVSKASISKINSVT